MYIISKAGGLIYSFDNQPASQELEVLCHFPLKLQLEEGDRGVMVKFGEEQGIKGRSSLHVRIY